MRRRILLAAAAAFWAAAALLGPARGAELPRARLDESERQFTRAYLYFMDRDYWSALDYLDRALRANTYLVDYYLLSGLSLQRTGDGEAARAALTNYLEVRPMDGTVPRIARDFVEQDRHLREIVGTRPLSARWRLSKPDLQTELGLPLARPFNVKGMGKAEALGKALSIADTFGDRVYLRPAVSKEYLSLEIRRPVTALPGGDGSFTMFCSEGDIYTFTCPLNGEPPASPELAGHIDAIISDAEALSETLFAVADPVTRAVSFYNIESGQPPEFLDAWAPPDTALLFEPVALDRYGEWLAVVDRGNGRVYFLNATNRREFFFAEVPAARDVLWSPLGELFVLTERGEIFCLGPDTGERTVIVGDPLWSGLTDIWALFPSEAGDLYCLDVAGFNLYKAAMLPSRALSRGFLGIYHPVLAMEKANRESFLIDATLGSPFTSYLQDAALSVQSIWNERTIRASAEWRESNRETLPGREGPALDGLLLHRSLARGQSLPPSLRAAQVERGRDIRAAVPPLWFLHKDTLTHVIADASIPFSIDDILYLMRFCLLNGLELDIWARDIPSLPLTRASAFTGGKTLLSLHRVPELPIPRTRLQIQIPLPNELSSSGYPSRSMLAIYLDIGLMQTRAWMPLWPDLTGQ